MMPREALVAAAAGTLTVLALFDQYAEVLAAATAYASAWWVLRERSTGVGGRV